MHEQKKKLHIAPMLAVTRLMPQALREQLSKQALSVYMTVSLPINLQSILVKEI